jgi:hypothetical protein
VSDVGSTVASATSGHGRRWLILGGVAGLAYLWYTRARNGPASAVGAASGAAQITPGGAAVADPVTPPGGDFSPPSDAPVRPTTNAEWLQQATATLIAGPYNRPPAATYNALLKALDGQPLTTSEVSIVEAALQVAGTPPEGMPPLNLAAPTGSPTPVTGQAVPPHRTPRRPPGVVRTPVPIPPPRSREPR